MKKNASEAMTKKLVTVPWNHAISEAYSLMEERKIRHLPVTDKDGFVVGILSDRDVNRAMNPVRPGFAEGLSVADFMSWPAITVDEGISVADVAEGMVDEKVSAFLVTKDGEEVVGIVTSEDLLKLLRSLLKGDRKSTLAALPYTPIVREVMRGLQTVGI
jgi:CBS domain-containing protein